MRMGDHFVLLVDRLLTESTLEAAIGLSKQLTPSTNDDTTIDFSCNIDSETSSLFCGKMVECRICQDEDVDSKMESPCSCCGSLKVIPFSRLNFCYLFFTFNCMICESRVTRGLVQKLNLWSIILFGRANYGMFLFIIMIIWFSWGP